MEFKTGDPVKQFFNSKTKKWHVFYKTDSKNQPIQIKKVVEDPLPGVEKIGAKNGSPAGETLPRAQSTSSKPQQNKTDDVAPKKNETEDQKKDDSKGFFDFF